MKNGQFISNLFLARDQAPLCVPTNFLRPTRWKPGPRVLIGPWRIGKRRGTTASEKKVEERGRYPRHSRILRALPTIRNAWNRLGSGDKWQSKNSLRVVSNFGDGAIVGRSKYTYAREISIRHDGPHGR